MHDITPALIAEIATRLYNELPGAAQVPKSPADVGNLPGNLPASAGASPPVDPSPVAPTSATTAVRESTQSLAPAALPSLSHFAPMSGVHPSNLAAAPPTAPRPGSPPLPGQAIPHAPGAGSASSMPYATEPTASALPQTAPASNGDGYDGLRRFIRGIRAPHSSGTSATSGNSECGEGFNHNWLQRIFSGGPVQVDGSRPLDVDAVRRDFPILHQHVHGRPLIWFDNAATTQKPQSVIDAVSRFYANDNSNIHRAAHTLAARATDAFEQARQKVQSFLGASSPQEIIFVRGTTEGINLVANTYGRKFLQPGDEIVLSTLEHHANIVPWQMIAKERGAVIRVIPVTDRGEIMLEDYQALMGPRTKFVSLTHASNSLGTILPVAEMTQMAKRYNARVLIDGAQSVAHLPVNVQSLGADFYVFSGHKIFAPTGIGAVFAKEELQGIVPPWQGGGSMIKDVTFEETRYSDPPAKFEAGTPNIADAVGLGAALDYVNRIGLPNIAHYEHGLLEYATERLARIDGLRLIGTAREKVSAISFVLPNHRTEDVGRMLDQEGIAVRSGHHCAQPSLRRFGLESTVRPSFSLYNTKGEIDHLVDTVRRIQLRP